MNAATEAITLVDLPPVTDQDEDDGSELRPSRLARRHRRLRTLFWVGVAVAAVAGFLLGNSVGRREAREAVRVSQTMAGAPLTCYGAVEQADRAIREAYQVNRRLVDYTSVMAKLGAGELSSKQALQHGRLAIKQAQVDSREFTDSLRGWRIARSHCWSK
jgi:uncharacterized protein YcfJ